MGEDTIVVLAVEVVAQVKGLGFRVVHQLIRVSTLTIMLGGRGRGSAEYAGPFPNFLNAAIDQSHLMSGYGSALGSDSSNALR